jgi:hypothetical protein
MLLTLTDRNIQKSGPRERDAQDDEEDAHIPLSYYVIRVWVREKADQEADLWVEKKKKLRGDGKRDEEKGWAKES